MPLVVWRQADAVRERKVAEARGQQDRGEALVNFEEVPAVLVAGEGPKQHAGAFDRRVPLSGQCVGMGEPVHVLDPCGGCDVDAGHDEAPGMVAEVVRDRDHDEVLPHMQARRLRLRSKRPADRVHLGAARCLHLDLDEAPLSAFREHCEDVGAFESVAGKRWCPTTPGKLSGDMVLADRLRLLRIDQDLRLSMRPDTDRRHYCRHTTRAPRTNWGRPRRMA